MKLLSKLFSKPSDLHPVQRFFIAVYFRVLQLGVVQQLPFKFTLFPPLDFSVECSWLARMLARHVATESLAMLEMVPAFFADVYLIVRLLFWWWQILYFRSRSSFLKQSALSLFYSHLLHRLGNHWLKAALHTGAWGWWCGMIFVFFDDAPNLSI